jgi:phenylacetyl-CoA:acceptor oxidoreductase subunit 2
VRQFITTRLQRYWDIRAAGNFSFGGTGGGLIVASALALAVDAASVLAIISGLGFIALGLFCVWLEIGRPWRAINVFLHPRTSWMTREALLVPPLFAAGGATVFDIRFAALAGAFAAAFLYCQARMLHASRGIPAWCQDEVVPLIVATGIAEGAGAYLVIANPSSFMIAVALAAGIAREVAREAYRRGVNRAKAPAGTLAWFSSPEERLLTAARLASIALLALALGGLHTAAAGGLLTVLTGWGLKAMLIVRAAFTRGHVIQHTPTRGRGGGQMVESCFEMQQRVDEALLREKRSVGR